jgi:hypothetical protein
VKEPGEEEKFTGQKDLKCIKIGYIPHCQITGITFNKDRKDNKKEKYFLRFIDFPVKCQASYKRDKKGQTADIPNNH